MHNFIGTVPVFCGIPNGRFSAMKRVCGIQTTTPSVALQQGHLGSEC
jgi:hypothetical protein